MITTLSQILDHIGFESRPQQLALYETLQKMDEPGDNVVAQAGTGTGKSIAVLAAAVDWRRRTGKPTLVVVPTNILMRQYLTVDAPRVSEALGVTIKALQGRNHYLCASAPGFAGLGRLPEEVIGLEPEMNQQLWGDDIVLATPHGYWFGCPGSDDCRGADEDEWPCHYRRAKRDLADADVIVTNAHLLIIDQQLKGLPPVERENEDGEVIIHQPAIFPEYGALFVDEAHTLEDNLRSFATRSIPRSAAEGTSMWHWIGQQLPKSRDPFTVTPNADLVRALTELERRPLIDGDGIKLKKHQREASEAARYILQRGRDHAYTEGDAVLWFEPQAHPRQPKLVSTQINLAGGARRLLTLVPTGLVSGTVPKSMRAALGIPDATFVDVGHPFDYSKQVTLKISRRSGAWAVGQNDLTNMPRRAEEVRDAVLEAGGGALLLFSSYRDMQAVHDQINHHLARAGLEVRMQDREGDKKALGEWFKDHGNAVLFGTESFATGFDVPGDALRLVSIWKLPYPGLDPVTRAISARSRQRYEDMMLMKVAQAAGRLIRTSTDVGTVLIVDARAEEKLLGRGDPMIAHFDDMAYERRVIREEY